MNITTHLCLVSSQPTPNLTPALDPATSPTRVVLLVSPDMAQRAEWLDRVLKPRGIIVAHWPIDDPWSIEHIQERVLAFLESEPDDALTNQTIALNATGGTKPMSIAAYKVFRDLELPVFYVHPELDRLIWMYPPERETVEIADRVRIGAFLEAHGVELEGELQSSIPDPGHLLVAEQLLKRMQSIGNALPILNGLASKAKNSLRTDRIEYDHDALGQLIDVFADGGYLTRDGGRLRFPDEASRFFVNGGWIENYVFDRVRRQRDKDPRIQDVAYSVQVRRNQRGQPVRNELDVIFLRDNRLHIIECKTRRFRGGGEDDPAAEALYKLDTLRDLMGGLQARAMLVNFLDLSGADRRRAVDLGISVCAGEQIRRLGEHLAGFMK